MSPIKQAIESIKETDECVPFLAVLNSSKEITGFVSSGFGDRNPYAFHWMCKSGATAFKDAKPSLAILLTELENQGFSFININK